jgi:hypothetical protein
MTESQVSIVQEFPSSQLTVVPRQTPPWQLSVCVQALPSLHATPLVVGGFAAHVPVPGLHAPWVWHWSGAGHTTGLAPVHTPT